MTCSAGTDGVGVHGLDGGEGINGGSDALGFQDGLGLHHFTRNVAGGEDGHTGAFADGNGLANHKFTDILPDDLLAAAAQPDIAGAGVLRHGLGHSGCLHLVGGGKDGHIGQGTHGGQVLGGVMAHAQGTVDEAAADADDVDIGAVVGTVVADLLDAAQGGEIADGVSEDGLTLQGHARRHGGHVLLGNAHVQELIGHGLPEGAQNTEAQVAGDQFHIFIIFRQFQHGTNKGISHLETSCRVNQVGR